MSAVSRSPRASACSMPSRIHPCDRGIYGTFGTLRYDYGRRGGMHVCGGRGMSEGTCTDSPTDESLGFKRFSIRTLPQHKQKTPVTCTPSHLYANYSPKCTETRSIYSAHIPLACERLLDPLMVHQPRPTATRNLASRARPSDALGAGVSAAAAHAQGQGPNLLVARMRDREGRGGSLSRWPASPCRSVAPHRHRHPRNTWEERAQRNTRDRRNSRRGRARDTPAAPAAPYAERVSWPRSRSYGPSQRMS
jgi:hypothetical protein